jgi:hypothetical protein
MSIQEMIDSAAPQDAMTAYLGMANALREQADTLDTSADSINALTQGMLQFQVATVQMVQAIDAAAASIHDMFMSTADSIRMSLMSEEERYAHLQSRADALFEQLLVETDPAKIKELAEKIDADINAAWGMLDEGQQSALGEQYLERITAIDEIVADKMAGLRDVVIEDAESMMVYVADRLQALFNQGDLAAQQQLEAANIQRETAREGVAVFVRNGDAIVTDYSGG